MNYFLIETEVVKTLLSYGWNLTDFLPTDLETKSQSKGIKGKSTCTKRKTKINEEKTNRTTLIFEIYISGY